MLIAQRDYMHTQDHPTEPFHESKIVLYDHKNEPMEFRVFHDSDMKITREIQS